MTNTLHLLGTHRREMPRRVMLKGCAVRFEPHRSSGSGGSRSLESQLQTSGRAFWRLPTDPRRYGKTRACITSSFRVGSMAVVDWELSRRVYLMPSAPLYCFLVACAVRALCRG
jgi:hypothetical protein